MKVKIDEDKCIGCLMCTSMADDIFETATNKNGIKAKVKDGVDFSDKKIQNKVKETVESCPVEAIIVED